MSKRQQNYCFFRISRRKCGSVQVTIEPVSENTSLCIQDCRSGIDSDDVEWFVVYFDVKYKREPGAAEQYIDDVSVKVAAVEKFSQKGTLGGTIPAVKGNIAMVYKGAVSFDDNFKLKYFNEDVKNSEQPKIQPQPKLEASKPKP